MKVVLLDTNLAALPIFDYLVDLGYEVSVLGSNKFDTLAQLSEKYVHIDYSNVELVEEYMDSNGVNLAIPGCNDVSYRSASILNENRGLLLNISSVQVDEILNDKNKFKLFALENHLRVPCVFTKNDIAESSWKKIIVKPVDSYSGKGVTVLQNFSETDLSAAVEFAESNSASKSCIIEEFVSGELYSHSAFVLDGDYFEDFIVKENCSAYSYAVDTSWVVDKEKFVLYNEIRDEVKKIILKLKLCNGLIHTQFIVDGANFWILEVTRRCPGDLYSKLIEYSTNFNYSKYYVDFILNLAPLRENSLERKPILRRTITFTEETVWYSLKQTNDNLKIFEFFPLSLSGKKLSKAPTGRAGIVFYSADCDFNFSDGCDEPYFIY